MTSTPKYVVILAAYLVLAVILGTWASDPRKVDNVILPDMPTNTPEWITSAKRIRVFVCASSPNPSAIPEILRPKAVAQRALKDINGRYELSVSSSDVIIKGCSNLYDPWMDESGNLSFIVKIRVIKAPADGKGTPYAMLTRIAYRPRGEGSIATFVETSPTLINLAELDEKAMEFYWIGEAWTSGY